MYPLSEPPVGLGTLALALPPLVLLLRLLTLGNLDSPLNQYSTPWPPMKETSAVQRRYGCRPRGEASVNAVMSEREEMEANVRIWRVDFVWMVESVREARDADGSSARDGRVMLVKV